MLMIPKDFLFPWLLTVHPVPAVCIAQLATEMQAGHMDQYGDQVGGMECYQQIIKGLIATSTTR